MVFLNTTYLWISSQVTLVVLREGVVCPTRCSLQTTLLCCAPVANVQLGAGDGRGTQGPGGATGRLRAEGAAGCRGGRQAETMGAGEGVGVGVGAESGRTSGGTQRGARQGGRGVGEDKGPEAAWQALW